MFGETDTNTPHPHVGVDYLSSWLKKNNVDVELFDDGVESSLNKLKDKVADSDADLIGLTMFSYCYQNGYDLINQIKENTDIPIVVGGAHVSSTKKQILQETQADFAVKLEGEKTLLELLNFVSRQKNGYQDIDGLLWRKNDKEIIENK